MAANERLVVALVEAYEVQEDAERRARELREIAEFRERLIGIVSHDLRNPLHAMMIGATFLDDAKNLSPSEREIVRGIIARLARKRRARALRLADEETELSSLRMR